MESGISRYVVRYSGHVQGVGFRMTAMAQAAGLRIHGFVGNQPDGSVWMDVEGPLVDLQELIRRIDVAMSGFIDGKEIEQRQPVGIADGFRIKH